jgi:hypothetical protein
MTDRRIVYARPDGGVGVIVPAEKARQKKLREDAVTRFAGPGARKDGKFLYAAVRVGPGVGEVDGIKLVDAIPKNGGLAERVLTHDSALRPETDDEFMERMRAKWVPSDARDVAECSTRDLPERDEFRDAWERDTDPQTRTAARVGMGKARAIHMDRIRAVRNKELERLDVEHLRAIEDDDKPRQVEIVQRKKKLRDIPRTFDLARGANPRALKALWPDDLPPPVDGG